MTKHRQGRRGHRRRRLSIEAPTFESELGDSKSVVRAIIYDKETIIDEKIETLEELRKLKDPSKVFWLDVAGSDDRDILSFIADLFGVHRFALEEVGASHRSKLVQFESQFFLVLQQLRQTPEITSQYIWMAIGQNYVITFHEGPWPIVDYAVDRLKKNMGSIRSSGADYLVYVLVDAVVDSYYPFLEVVGEQLEDIETEIIENPQRGTVTQVHTIKRNLLMLRRAIWPIREAVNALLRDGPPLFMHETILHLRDPYDHAVQIIDFIETYRELAADLMDVYLSSISNKMNEVMKVLTIITTFFVPPTLIAGIYGMNFKTEVSPFNMPELSWYFGYPFSITLMLLVALATAYFLWSKGWLGQVDDARSASDPSQRVIPSYADDQSTSGSVPLPNGGTSSNGAAANGQTSPTSLGASNSGTGTIGGGHSNGGTPATGGVQSKAETSATRAAASNSSTPANSTTPSNSSAPSNSTANSNSGTHLSDTFRSNSKTPTSKETRSASGSSSTGGASKAETITNGGSVSGGGSNSESASSGGTGSGGGSSAAPNSPKKPK